MLLRGSFVSRIGSRGPRLPHGWRRPNGVVAARAVRAEAHSEIAVADGGLLALLLVYETILFFLSLLPWLLSVDSSLSRLKKESRQ